MVSEVCLGFHTNGSDSNFKAGELKDIWWRFPSKSAISKLPSTVVMVEDVEMAPITGKVLGPRNGFL